MIDNVNKYLWNNKQFLEKKLHPFQSIFFNMKHFFKVSGGSSLIFKLSGRKVKVLSFGSESPWFNIWLWQDICIDSDCTSGWTLWSNWPHYSAQIDRKIINKFKRNMSKNSHMREWESLLKLIRQADFFANLSS